jgi:prolyl-tRNA synthetase
MVFKRPEHDKFAGAEYSIAYDSPMPNGKVLQIGTTHHLGQNFAKPFKVKFLDTDGVTKFVHQTSYGLSTRLIASILATHGDDQGLILPPMLAPIQIVIVPIIFKKKTELVLEACKKLEKEIRKWDYRVTADLRTQYTSGWKYAEWEMRGVPLRIEIGPRDIQNEAVMTVRRDTMEKESIGNKDLKKFVKGTFTKISKNLKKRADKILEEIMREASSFDELKDIMTNNRGIVRSNWCNNLECAQEIKDNMSASILGNRHNIDEIPDGPCIVCGEDAKSLVYVAASM